MNTSENNRGLLIAIAVVVLILIGAGIWYSMRGVESSNSEDISIDVSTSTPATTTPTTATSSASSAPSAEAVAAKKKADFDAQMTKGNTAYKAGNYEQARISWEAASKTDPTNYNSFASLGQLYAVNLKNNTKAEVNYLTAIKNTPAPYSAPLYRNLYELYRSTNRDFSAIERILKDAIARTPTATEFYVLLAREYKAMQLYPEARVQFDAAIRSAGTNATLVAQLEAEKASF